MAGASNEQIDLANPFIPLSLCALPPIYASPVYIVQTPPAERIHTDKLSRNKDLWGHEWQLWHVVIRVSRIMLHELLYWIFSNYKNFFQFLVGEDLSVENRPIH